MGVYVWEGVCGWCTRVRVCVGVYVCENVWGGVCGGWVYVWRGVCLKCV